MNLMGAKSAGLALLLLPAAAGAALAQGLGEAARKVYEKAGESVVAVRASGLGTSGESTGTGVVLSKDGLILTSTAVCPEVATRITVRTRGPRQYEGKIVAASPKDEVVLLRIQPRGELKEIEFGRSSAVRVGDASYTLGNAANALWNDDQPSLNVGIVSGFYRLREERARSTYTGNVLETTAAVNVGMEGAPCLDAEGRMIGLVTLNYSPNRFLGAAIPIDDLKPLIDRLQAPAAQAAAAPAEGEGTLGLKVKEEGGKVVISEVDKGGPADEQGLSKGDVIVEIADLRVSTARDLLDRLKGLEAGSVVWLKVDLGGEVRTFKLTLEKKK
jgi:putative serine protease PepD